MGEPTEAVVFLSGGLTSWASAKRTVKKYSAGHVRFLFTDVLIEDADAYRLLISGAANALGRTLAWKVPAAEDFPQTYLPLVRGERPQINPAWLAFLADLRTRCARDLPELVWLSDGRSPWDVFHNVKSIGNTRRDPCSKYLKRELGRKWLRNNCDPATTALVFGIGWDEEHRYDGDPVPPSTLRRGVKNAYGRLGYPHVEAPMLVSPWMTAWDLSALARLEAVPVPRLYVEGFEHNNCGGACVKAGEGQWAHLLAARPRTYAAWEASEIAFNAARPGRVVQTVLAPERVIGVDAEGRPQRKRVPISLTEFREQIEAGMPVSVFGDAVGCGACFLDDA